MAQFIPFIWKDEDSFEDYEFLFSMQKKILFLTEGFFILLELLPQLILQGLNSKIIAVNSLDLIVIGLNLFELFKMLRNIFIKLSKFAKPYENHTDYDFLIEVGRGNLSV